MEQESRSKERQKRFTPQFKLRYSDDAIPSFYLTHFLGSIAWFWLVFFSISGFTLKMVRALGSQWSSVKRYFVISSGIMLFCLAFSVEWQFPSHFFRREKGLFFFHLHDKDWYSLHQILNGENSSGRTEDLVSQCAKSRWWRNGGVCIHKVVEEPIPNFERSSTIWW